MGYFAFRKKPRICRPEMILDALEERIVLDATVDQAAQDNQDNAAQNNPQAQTQENAGQTAQGGAGPGQAAAPTAPTPSAEQVFNQDLNVVLISNALADVQVISQAAADNAEVIVYDSSSDNLGTIGAKLDTLVQSSGQKIGALAVVDHATDGLIHIGTDNIGSANLFKFVSTLEHLAGDLTENAQIQFYGCSIAGDASGQSLVDQIALYTTADIFASSDNTGGKESNWTLEYASADGLPLTQLFDSVSLPTDGSALIFYDPGLPTPPIYPGGAYAPPLDSLSTCYQYYSALDDQDQITVHPTWSASYSETWHFVLTSATTISIGMQTVHPELTHGQAGFIDCAIDLYPSTSEYGEPDPATRITQNDDWGAPGDRTHAPYYSGNDALIYNYSLPAGTYAIQATHWSDPINQPLYNWQTGGYYLLSTVELAYWTHNHPNAPASDGIPNPPTQPEEFTPSYQYDTGQFFSDPQGDTLTYEFGTVTFYGLTLGGGTPTIDPNTGVATFTNSPDSSGYVTMQVRAFDGELYSQYHTFTFTVTPEQDWYVENARVVAPRDGGTVDVWVTGHDSGMPLDSEVLFLVLDPYSVEHGTLSGTPYLQYLMATDVYHDADGTYHGKYTYTSDPGYYGEDAFQFWFAVQKGGTWGGFPTGSGGTAVGDAQRTFSVQFGDLNNDGFVDIVEGNYNQANRYFLNDGAGTFTPTSLYDTTNDNTVSIRLGDLNGDGWLDIVACNTGQQDWVYMNQGYDRLAIWGGTPNAWAGFDNGHAVSTATGTKNSIALGDLDGDGDLDLVVGISLNSTGATVLDRVHFNDGMGNFSTGTNIPSNWRGSTYSVAIGDMDGDGDLDIIAGKYRNSTDLLYRNNGTGSFTASLIGGTSGDQTYSVKIADLDNDGDLDFVAGNSGYTSKVYINDGAGVFAQTAIGTNTYTTYSIDLADLNRDGYLDLVLGNYNQLNRYYTNPGNGLFTGTPAQIGNASYYTQSVDLADVDGDGDLDFLAGNGRTNNSQQNRMFYNSGFGAGSNWLVVDPGEVNINVSIMTNPSFEVDYSADHQGGYSGWTPQPIPDPDYRSTFGVVPNKQVVNDLAPMFDHHTEKNVMELPFGLSWNITDKTADTTENIAILLANDARHVIVWQDVTIPATGGLTDLELHWRMSYQNEYGWLDPANAFDATNQYLALYVYDPSGAKGTPLWITTTANTPISVDSLQEYRVDLPVGLWPTAGADSTVRVEFEVMAQNWFFDVAIDDFLFLPDPPGAVTSGPIVMMAQAAQEFAFGPSQSYSVFTPLDQWANQGTLSDSLAMASSTVDPNSLKLLEVLETASQTAAAPLSTVTVLESATGVTETLAAQSTSPSGGSSTTTTTEPVITAPTTTVAATTEPVSTTSEPTSSDSGTLPSAPTSTDFNPAIAPEPITLSSVGLDVSYWLAASESDFGFHPLQSVAASDSVDAAGDAPAVQDLTPDPSTSLAFNLEDVSAWDVLKSSMANTVDPQVDPGLRSLAARLASGESLSLDIDSISLTKIFG